MHFRHLSLSFFALSTFCFSFVVSAGPMQTAITLRDAAVLNGTRIFRFVLSFLVSFVSFLSPFFFSLSFDNSACAVGAVAYTNPATQLTNCGECNPFSSDLSQQCDINSFCNNHSRCQSLLTHPLYNAECPISLDLFQVVSWCGGVLQCLSHHCLVCREGEFNWDYYRTCYHSLW